MRPLALSLVILAGCSNKSTSNGLPAPFEPEQPYAPDVSADELSMNVTHPLFPLPVGARWVYEAQTDEGVERIEVTVMTETRAVYGADARIVRDTSFLDGVMAEDTRDWFAQDADGHVWYLGEDTAEYEDGVAVSTAGSWEAGMGGALTMPGEPKVGDIYRQEYLQGEAEDYAEVVSTSETVTVPAGSFSGCVKTRDRSAIEPGLDEFKYYCPSVGNVLVEEGDVRVELIEYSGL
jgi:hypothetical protein